MRVFGPLAFALIVHVNYIVCVHIEAMSDWNQHPCNLVRHGVRTIVRMEAYQLPGITVMYDETNGLDNREDHPVTGTMDAVMINNIIIGRDVQKWQMPIYWKNKVGLHYAVAEVNVEGEPKIIHTIRTYPYEDTNNFGMYRRLDKKCQWVLPLQHKYYRNYPPNPYLRHLLYPTTDKPTSPPPSPPPSIAASVPASSSSRRRSKGSMNRQSSLLLSGPSSPSTSEPASPSSWGRSEASLNRQMSLLLSGPSSPSTSRPSSPSTSRQWSGYWNRQSDGSWSGQSSADH